MTTWHEIEVPCALCGHPVPTTRVASTTIFGPSDLDTRPAPLARMTVEFGIACCPACGYCAPDIDKAPPQAANVIASPTYQATLHDDNLPLLARYYLCWSHIAEAAHTYDKAGWAALRAAWVCDDANAHPEAKTCRERAAHLFQLAQAHEQPFASDDASEYAILADVLRRSGHFEEAIVAAEEGLRHTPEPLVAQVLRFQITLAHQHDDTRYTLGNIPQTDDES